MNSIMSQQGCQFTTVQLKGKLSRLRRAWRLLNDLITKGTGWGWDSEKNTITNDAGRLEELYQIIHIIWQIYMMREVPSKTPQVKARGHWELQEVTNPMCPEFQHFRNLICPELFRENVQCNTSLLQGAEWIAEIMTTPHQGPFSDNIRMTKPCFYALVDALTSRGLLPHGQTSRVISIEEVALFLQTVGMHKRQCDNMERFQHSLETINRRFHRVLSTLCSMAPELITRPDFTETHTRIANNPDFYPFFTDCVGAMDGTLIPAWVPRVDQNRYRS
ncbi:UNVERIFIED_CONTAM: hypothetical protein Sradi_4418600 [Sesamum radiatum]|uniref:DUF8040 domain-containing protein n=1 Tax=Sesamum radiatum TaxID=300843 RepID=A0AAW2NRG6_SESRA